VLSIDIGITPGKEQVPGAAEHTTGVKPIDRFVLRLDDLLARAAAATTPLKVVVVGGGAGGVEIALSIQYRLEQERIKAGRPESMRASVSLVCRGTMLGGHTGYARRSIIAIMQQKGVTVLENCKVSRVEAGKLVMQRESKSTGQQGAGSGVNGGGKEQGGAEEVVAFDECLWCTQAAAASWIKDTGLPTDAQGFIATQETLQVAEGGPPEVFAAGDVATCLAHPRPKAGVFAVRAGPPLVANIRRFLTGEPLQPHVPQTTFLSLITTGDRHCVGTKGWLGTQGSWMWGWKDSIDRSFMAKYSTMLDEMDAKGMMGGEAMGTDGLPPAVASAAGPEALALVAAAKMRCGGCGAKVGASVLSRALARLPPSVARPEVVVGLGAPDDAALIRPPPPGKLLVQSVDFFRAFWDDPFLFGQIAAVHALGDVWAMGGQPVSALALATVPLAAETIVEDDLVQAMAGALKVLNEANCSLVGGHTTEGTELALGFSVTGEVGESEAMAKGGLTPGQALVLTKALGTGTLMAGAMRGKAKGRWVMGALQQMSAPSGKAAEILRKAGARGATDVTGFGLLGHLVEMTRPSKVHAQLEWGALPLLPGAAECLGAGVLSSLHLANAKASSSVSNFEQLKGAQPQLWPILVDPQTGGGLLAGVPGDKADTVVQELREAGYSTACVIGRVVEMSEERSPVTVTGL